ncbi:MAG TPA: hypothetical protein P5114_07875 [Hyphomicrobiaceae bacterium]|nr:hypothetical protein [Hyphomicrobiaceae bacterium]
MNISKTLTAAAALATVALVAGSGLPARAETLELTKPMAGSTMFFADRYASAYYLVDKSNFKTVVTVAPGPNAEGNPMQFVNYLSDGESAEYSVGGYGTNAITVKLKLHRDGDTVKANVTTETPSNS